ncbi:MAG: hypothetical protein AB7H88_17445 [Vicinamibacterales bacterium]
MSSEVPAGSRADRLARRLGITRALLAALRVEAESAAIGARARAWPPARRALAAIRHGRGLLVNVACGPFPLDGFVNLDLRAYVAGVVPWDCRRSLPCADGACAGIRIEHWVEHLDPRDELPALLAACARALAPGGVLRIIVPDAGRFLAAYAAGGRGGFDALGVPDPLPDDLPTPLDVVAHTFHQWGEHRWGFDAENLAWRLSAAGLADVTREAFGRSRLAPLGADRAEHAKYSLYVEAVRPADGHHG